MLNQLLGGGMPSLYRGGLRPEPQLSFHNEHRPYKDRLSIRHGYPSSGFCLST